jgi:hypothetical protein
MRKPKGVKPSSSAAATFDMVPALCGAVLVTQVLSSRVLSGLQIRPTQWLTLTLRLAQWNAWIASPASRADNRTRCHLSVLIKLLTAILDHHLAGRDAPADDWETLKPFLAAADEYLQTFPVRRRKASTHYPPAPSGVQHLHH